MFQDPITLTLVIMVAVLLYQQYCVYMLDKHILHVIESHNNLVDLMIEVFEDLDGQEEE